MSEEVLETENTDEEVESTEEDEAQDATLTIEDYKQIVSKLRREAGNRRLKGKEIEVKLKEYEDWKKSQMSAVELAQTEKAELEKELSQYRTEKLQKDVAKKAQLDAEFADLIKGDSEEEMLAYAKVLKQRLGPAKATTEGLRPGARGGPVGADNTKEEINEWFRNAMRA